MSRTIRLAFVSLLFAACAQADSEGPAGAESAETSPAQDRAALAMSAAPAEIAAEATLMDRDETGALVPLRDGTNGWLCVTDENPVAPGEYPACLDGAWQAWFAAYQAGEPPEIDGIGMSYMLQGGPAASNTDPLATAPPEGGDWLMDPPHLMVIVPDPAMLDAFPTEHGSGGPYVMWAGTPYAHLMVPTAPH
jgi:hypothetical protein